MKSNKRDKKMRVLDFFCGAGGWSEGLRQQGFEVVKGIDNWRPAVETHNLNHGLHDEPIDILDYEKCAVGKIDEDFADVEMIVGSPPCVSFSMSNKAGKADKSLGIRLIETYLRIVAYKKFKPGSKLKVWYMENVPNSRNFVKETYTFKDLNLGAWAKEAGISPTDVALKVKDNGGILCAADYGSPQSRERFVCGEWVKTGEFVAPKVTHEGKRVTLGQIVGALPSPVSARSKRAVVDPNYPDLSLPLEAVTDQFYDTGVYEVEWESSKAAKVNHPFMGKMSFPENPDKPSRTIMATRSASTREALIYRSESGRKGDGEYRLPTIREASSLMGFPITYQYTGSEGTKWRQIGNAVCPHMSAAVGKALRERMKLEPLEKPIFAEPPKCPNDLNTFSEASLDRPPLKKPDARFRRQPFKSHGLAAALVNFDPSGKDASWTPGSRWEAALILGSGKDFKSVTLGDAEARHVAKMLKSVPGSEAFVEAFRTEFSGKIADRPKMQKMFVEHRDIDGFVRPTALVDRIGEFVDAKAPKGTVVCTPEMRALTGKDEIPLRHLYAMYAIAAAARPKLLA